MSSKSERRAAREAVADYHEARLAELVQRVGEAVDRFRAGELDAFGVDQILFQYSRPAKKLWKLACWHAVSGCPRRTDGRSPERGLLTRRRAT